MHETVIGLLINKVEFGLDIHAKGSCKNKLAILSADAPRLTALRKLRMSDILAFSRLARRVP